MAKALESKLFSAGKSAYYLGLPNQLLAAPRDGDARETHIRAIAETAEVLTDAGMIVLTTVSYFEDHEAQLFRALLGNTPMHIVGVGDISLVDTPVIARYPSKPNPDKVAEELASKLGI